MYSQIKRHRTSIVIYYSYSPKNKEGKNKVQITRHPTGVKVTLDTKGIPIDWDDKKNELKTNADNYIAKVKQITAWRKRADEIIVEYNGDGGAVISADILSNALKNYKSGVINKKTAQVVELFKEFEEFKLQTFKTRRDRSEESGKDYTTLLRTFEDYNNEFGEPYTLVKDGKVVTDEDGKPVIQYKKPLLINDINGQWLQKWNNWLMVKRPEGSQTKGGLNNQTIRKRYEILIEFYNYLKGSGKIESNEFIREEKRKLKVPLKKKTTLTVDEIYKLYDIDFTPESHNRVKEYFVFICLTGLRFDDFQTLEKKHLYQCESRIEGKGNYWVIRKIAEKTKNLPDPIELEIPLTPLAYDILAKYGFRFPTISNQKMNEYLYEILKKSNLFNDDSKEKVDNNSEDEIYKPRYEILTIHKGRDSFISNMVETVPVHEVMKMSGHRDMEILYKYIDKTRPVEYSYANVLDRPKQDTNLLNK